MRSLHCMYTVQGSEYSMYRVVFLQFDNETTSNLNGCTMYYIGYPLFRQKISGGILNRGNSTEKFQEKFLTEFRENSDKIP